MIPNEKKIREILLLELYASKNHSAIPKDLYKQVGDYFPNELEEIDFAPYQESESKWANEVQWTRAHLVKEGIILSPKQHKRNEWKLSEEGIKLGRDFFIKYHDYDPWLTEISIDNITNDIIEKFQPNDEQERFPEGKIKFVLHTTKERNQKVVTLKKKLAYDKNPLMPCEICGTSFKEKYGEIGDGFIEAHHIYPISELTEETETHINDLILVCSNCHKIIHQKRLWLTIENMQTLLNE